MATVGSPAAGREFVAIACVAIAVAIAQPARAQPATAPAPPALHRLTAPIKIDGVLDDAGWQDVPAIDQWYETSPGNNTPPKARTRGRVAYDGEALYVALQLDDPDASRIRAPIGDHDGISSNMDYAGIILDSANTGRTGTLFLVTPSGVQYDSVSDDSTGIEDASPDFFWDSAAHIDANGWTLEIRIPFSSLSYARRDPQVFRFLLFRNYPRDFRYKLFNVVLPRDSTCFICQARPVALRDLPAGGSLVVAPDASAKYAGAPSGQLGSRLHYGDPSLSAGFDAKWRPTAGSVVDVTVNPDFSQIESDVALISSNERFALLYPEKRPFFLEGVELLQTPLSAVNTRSLTDPLWGTRATVKFDKLAFTALAVQDEGGGSVIIPGASSSQSADQQFRSWAGIARARYDLGPAFIGGLFTTRDIEDGGYNQLGGLDFQARPSPSDSVTGQALYSVSRTPDRPDLATEWDGRSLAGHAALLKWSHADNLLDFQALYRDLGSQFRADDGFVPQVGVREGFGEAGITTRPDSGYLRRLQGFATYDRITNPGFDLVSQTATVATSMDLTLSSSLQLSYQYDQILVAGKLLSRNEAVYSLAVNPGAVLTNVAVSGSAGQQIDFENARTGTGFDITLSADLRPTSHLEISSNEELRWVNDDVPGQGRSRLFTARIDRLNATYSFTARMYLRLTGQYQVTTRAPELYLAPVNARDADFSGQLLFAYKINWQSVLFLGYGDARQLLPGTDRLEPKARQLFVKISRAFQW
jgi:hypothetical protein